MERVEIVRRIETSFAGLDKLAAEQTRAAELLPHQSSHTGSSKSAPTDRVVLSTSISRNCGPQLVPGDQ
jgi:hypothetical protein